MPKTYYPNGYGFNQKYLKKDKPPKPNRKSGFRQLASSKKYECKALTEYLLLRWENEFDTDFKINLADSI